MVPVETFLEQHPEHVDDENALMVARINDEHAQREALEQARQGLLKKKQGLIANNKKRRDDLANLDRDLEKFIDVSIDCTSEIDPKTRTDPFDRRRRNRFRPSLGLLRIDDLTCYPVTPILDVTINPNPTGRPATTIRFPSGDQGDGPK